MDLRLASDDVVVPEMYVTGCSLILESGEFLGGGDYRIQAASGGDLTWIPRLLVRIRYAWKSMLIQAWIQI